MKDSLYSFDLFRCESVALRTYWVLVVLDQYTRRIIGFGIHVGIVDGRALLPHVPSSDSTANDPKYLSSDHVLCIDFISGKRTFASSALRRSKQCPMCQYRIRSSSD
jgi:hypothetical protein